MAIKVNRTFKGETSSVGDDKQETWMYDVHADSLTFTVNEAKYANDGTNAIPEYASTHPDDPEMTCANISAARDADLPTLIRVTVDWRSPKAGEGGATVPEGQTKIWAIELGFDRESYTELRNRDLDDKPLINSADDFFEPQEKKGSDRVYLYSYYVKNLDWIKVGDAHGCVNDADVVLKFNGRQKTFAKHTLMIEPRFSVVDKIETRSTDGSTTLTDYIYKVECRLTYREKTWFLKLIDQGLNYYNDQSKKVRIVGDDKQPVSDPRMLDGNGGLLEEGAEVVLLPVDDDGNTTDGFRMVDLISFTTLPGFGG